MKKICAIKTEEEIREVQAEMKITRKPRKSNGAPLNQHTAQVLAWARGKNVSKRQLIRLIKKHLAITISPDIAYNFVKKNNGGVWPNARRKEK